MWSQIAPWPENIDLILSTYQKEMIETDSYLYTANNDRDYAGSDEHNRSISCPANIFTRTSLLDGYAQVYCHLDNDEAGENACDELQKRYGDKVIDHSHLYTGYKDLNEYLMSHKARK